MVVYDLFTTCLRPNVWRPEMRVAKLLTGCSFKCDVRAFCLFVFVASANCRNGIISSLDIFGTIYH